MIVCVGINAPNVAAGTHGTNVPKSCPLYPLPVAHTVDGVVLTHPLPLIGFVLNPSTVLIQPNDIPTVVLLDPNAV